MAYLAVNKKGIEVIFHHLPKGSIEKLIGKKLTWKDEPVEIKGI